MNSSMLAQDYKPPFAVHGLMLRVKELEEQHVAFRNSLICAFNQLLDLKDISTGVHSTRLAEWAIQVARKLNIPEEHLYLEVAALLHDIGKIGVPDAILKKNGAAHNRITGDHQSSPGI
jgi:HD-GYP domain-containing protein (c-di-GMP phosphodiesterase class II)